MAANRGMKEGVNDIGLLFSECVKGGGEKIVRLLLKTLGKLTNNAN